MSRRCPRRYGAMAPPAPSPLPRLISDELWAVIEPIIPPRPPAAGGRTGRPRTSDRDVLEGIAFVLSTGIGWARLPAHLGYGSGWTCWRRMREWQEAGVLDRLLDAVRAPAETGPVELPRPRRSGSALDGEPSLRQRNRPEDPRALTCEPA